MKRRRPSAWPGRRRSCRSSRVWWTATPAYLLGRRVPDGDKIEVLEVLKGLPPSYEVFKEKLDALLASK